jgi:hypothetical protein
MRMTARLNMGIGPSTDGKIIFPDIPHMSVSEGRTPDSPTEKARLSASRVGIEGARTVDRTHFPPRERSSGHLRGGLARSWTHLARRVAVALLALDAHAGSGSGRSRSIRRKISPYHPGHLCAAPQAQTDIPVAAVQTLIDLFAEVVRSAIQQRSGSLRPSRRRTRQSQPCVD